jgi:hypothetical protein
MKIFLAVLLTLIAFFGMCSTAKIHPVRRHRIRPEYPGEGLEFE